ncbi:hypothetical protein LCGC14_2873040 [marine sediment metagenome]|uniref:Uncharacterized protein n=1 Tax=marine sediment metagenome TaxID=412755 RepID=A0A0F8Y2I7_9ZZZZ
MWLLADKVIEYEVQYVLDHNELPLECLAVALCKSVAQS